MSTLFNGVEGRFVGRCLEIVREEGSAPIEGVIVNPDGPPSEVSLIRSALAYLRETGALQPTHHFPEGEGVVTFLPQAAEQNPQLYERRFVAPNNVTIFDDELAGTEASLRPVGNKVMLSLRDGYDPSSRLGATVDLATGQISVAGVAGLEKLRQPSASGEVREMLAAVASRIFYT